ncbi:MAG: hypothetical protein J6T63_04785 [Bacteroidales bacterium]|nr:hypothetical protein [Bacteroidales bacterium]
MKKRGSLSEAENTNAQTTTILCCDGFATFSSSYGQSETPEYQHLQCGL